MLARLTGLVVEDESVTLQDASGLRRPVVGFGGEGQDSQVVRFEFIGAMNSLKPLP
jgi:hypothetical protein